MRLNLPVQRGFCCWPVLVIPKRVISTEEEAPYVVHEMTHYKRQAWWSLVWLICYFASKSFRMKEETLAYRAQISAYTGLDREWYVQTKAAAMESGYWGMCSYDEALEALTN